MKGEVPEGYYTIPLGKADIKREGSDVNNRRHWKTSSYSTCSR